jgi:hypothetical protein
MAHPLTVFVCSSFADLSEERQAVVAAIQSLRLQHDAMEFFGARESAPLEACLAEVRQSDVLIVIVGFRYGSLVPGKDVSFSEAEYLEAVLLGKPCLVYLRDPSVPVLIKDVERDAEKVVRLERWKDTLQERHTISLFLDARDLAARVSKDLDRTAKSLLNAREAQSSATAASAKPSLREDLPAILQSALDEGVSEGQLVSALRQAIAGLASSRTDRPPAVVFSYSGSDAPFVREVAAELLARGIEVWLDTMHVPNASKWLTQLESALDRSDFYVFFLSSAYLASPWTAMELEVILARRLERSQRTVLLPVQLEPVDAPPLLRTYKYLDLSDHDPARGAEKLAAAIGAQVRAVAGVSRRTKRS